MALVALYTVGVLREAPEHPMSSGFVERGGGVVDAASTTDGFCSFDALWDPAPQFIPKETWGRTAQTLSTWRDLESVFAFSYSGRHGDALRHRREWFLKLDVPVYVLWWLDEQQKASFPEAFARIETLHANGPDSKAFNFQRMYNADGVPYSIDRDVVRSLRVSAH